MTTNPLKTSTPIFEVTLPTTQQKVSCRPFLVKEDRILLGAKESGTPEDIALAVQQIVRNCVLDRDFDVTKLNTIDMNALFLRIRSEAVGNVVKVDFVCNNTPEGSEQECGGEFQFVLDLKTATHRSLQTFEEVELTPEYMVKFRYPLFEKIRNIKSTDTEEIQTAKKVQAVVDYVVSKDKDAKEIVLDDLSLEFINEFIEGLTTDQLGIINQFIDDIPEMMIDAKTKCPKCGFEHDGHFENLQSFFQ